MRVLQIHNRYRYAGGEERVVAHERRVIEDAGGEVMAFDMQNPLGVLGAMGTLALSAWNPMSARALDRLLKDQTVDIAHVHNTWYAMTPSILGTLARANVPVVMTLHNYRLACVNAQLQRNAAPCEACVGRGPWNGVRYRCYRGSLIASGFAAGSIALHRWLRTWEKRVSTFIVFNRFSRRLFTKAGLPEEKLSIKPNFTFDPGPRRAPARASKRILYVGRLSEEKGIAQVLHAWKEARREDMELCVVGDGPLRAELESRAGEGVTFLGPAAHDDVVDLMLSSRALLFPSRWYEGQPMVVVEALSCGLPVFAVARGAAGEMLEDLPAEGLLEDDAQWPDVWSRIASDELMETMSVASRREYDSRYRPDVVGPQLLSLYRAAAHGGR